MARKADPMKKLVEAAMELAAETGWRGLGLADVARKAGVPLGEMRLLVRDRTDILKRFMADIDARVLDAAAQQEGTEEAARDRLFDVLMLRFELLQPYRAALRRINDDLRADPAAGLALAGTLFRSMDWMLIAADIRRDGPLGALKDKGLAGAYLSVQRTWLNDTDPGLARTMAALDRALRRGEDTLRAVSIPIGLAGAALRFASAFAARSRARREEPGPVPD